MIERQNLTIMNENVYVGIVGESTTGRILSIPGLITEKTVAVFEIFERKPEQYDGELNCIGEGTQAKLVIQSSNIRVFLELQTPLKDTHYYLKQTVDSDFFVESSLGVVEVKFA